ncbi:MAG: magnesium/cobalt transporter CorA [Planctomycetota bacterium]|nr:magnesium/cobalt transporter CorA [Planctomycetaceae bacterium]MDQ3330809.1 magnesium/cobalt transporter CorA [Planctomycetota bacterium]
MPRRWKTGAVRKPPLARIVRKASKPFRRRTKPGAAPGAFRIDPQAPKPVVNVIAFGPLPEQIEEVTDCELSVLPDLLSRYPVTWVNVDGLGDAGVIERLGEMFELHALALEDVVHVHQRAKVEDYDDNLFVVARMAWFPSNGEPSPDDNPAESAANGQVDVAKQPGDQQDNGEERRPDTEQVSLFLGKNFVVTFQERPGSDSFEPVRTRLRRRRGRLREQGADTLAYSLLDAIIDGYFPVIEELGSRLERLDDDILSRIGHDHLQRLHRLRGDLLVLRKNLWPLREAIHSLIRDPHPLISEETHYFLRDCYDHTVQLLDVVETYRELCADLREYHYAQVSARTNDVMKVLTIISTIFIPLTFIAGVYGMNFDTNLPGNMPELELPYAYPITMLVMAVIAAVLLIGFWKKGWLRGEDRSSK